MSKPTFDHAAVDAHIQTLKEDCNVLTGRVAADPNNQTLADELVHKHLLIEALETRRPLQP